MLMLFLRELLFLYPCQTFQFQLETFDGGENIMKLKIKSYTFRYLLFKVV